MENTLARLNEFAENKKEVADFFTTTLSLINLAQKQGVTLPDAYFEGIIIMTNLIFSKNIEQYGK